jgi:DNA-binding transcriptional ArsR family regulator
MSPALTPREARPTLDTVFAALADPTRRSMIERLKDGEATVNELADPFDISVPAVSRHLHVLEEAGLVARRKEGRKHFARLVQDPLRGAVAWMIQYGAFWEDQLDSLADLFGGASEGAP